MQLFISDWFPAWAFMFQRIQGNLLAEEQNNILLQSKRTECFAEHYIVLRGLFKIWLFRRPTAWSLLWACVCSWSHGVVWAWRADYMFTADSQNIHSVFTRNRVWGCLQVWAVQTVEFIKALSLDTLELAVKLLWGLWGNQEILNDTLIVFPLGSMGKLGRRSHKNGINM